MDIDCFVENLREKLEEMEEINFKYDLVGVDPFSKKHVLLNAPHGGALSGQMRLKKFTFEERVC